MNQGPRIFIPQPIRSEGLRLLEEVGRVEMIDSDRMLSRDELSPALARSDYLLCIGDLAIDRDLLMANRHLKGIACAARDVTGWIDLDLATSLKIPVSGLSSAAYGTICQSTADLTMALLLALAWRVQEADAYTRLGRFRQEQTIHFTCSALAGKTLGMIGLGSVARFVAPRARSFELKVIYTKRERLQAEEEARLGITWAPSLDEVLATSDFLSIHANYSESTHSLIGKRELQLMKRSAFLINTARGRIVDEPSLIRALRARMIAGAGLDVYWGEPPVTATPKPDPELLKLDNVILTPHIGGQTEASLIAIAQNQAENLIAMIRGQRPPDLRNAEVYA